MREKKPKLSIEEQIVHLKEKGVTFDIIDEDYARSYLRNNNNYFKLTSYRKNYQKHPDGINKGKYIKLDFAYLVDMAVIDMRLRYLVVQMALDIEHHVKLHLLRLLEESTEDGYQIVTDYIDSLSEKQKQICEGELARNKGNVYCGDLIEKYDGCYPMWVFLEIIPFGRLIDFYRFCGERYGNKRMKSNFYKLLMSKEIRNASAHSNCILNDLSTGTSKYDTSKDIARSLLKIEGISVGYRNLKMSNARIQQIVTLLYVHCDIVSSQAVHETTGNLLKDLLKRIEKNTEYYKDNQKISGSLEFLKLVVDNWFQIA